MKPSTNPSNGETGCARVQRYEEALNLYSKLRNTPNRIETFAYTRQAFLTTNLVEGRRLRVHLFDTSKAPPRFLTHTCGKPCIVSQQSAQTSLAVQPVSAPAARPAADTVVTTPVRSFEPVAALEAGLGAMRIDSADPRRNGVVPFYGGPVSPQQPQLPLTIPVQYATMPNTNYVSNTAGLPVNQSEGVIPTEYRGVFVGGLDYSARSKDIVRCFERAGEIVKCDLQKDATSGKFKGNATIQYATAKQARTAVCMFHQQKFMGMRIKVRFDKDSVPLRTSPTSSTASASRSKSNAANTYEVQRNAQPLIVNGSVAQR